ncbi:GAF domain-containing protein [Nostoc sp. FACHB-280]|uniref:GAF domain-containing protein n=1 Tax=Nostoc sp. FACHB-280 TaxID=2692839 RepID=UPI00168AB162|nr:GAF domain-containing protein [Nostoc sp. FACHB-280]MBD2495849.1 GAF domain-containing protein [Nostoc sp. FACHB-280]
MSAPKHLGENSNGMRSNFGDRILEATTIAVNALLTIDNFDEAVKTALQVMGESLDCDRLGVIEHFPIPLSTLPGWRSLYEWNAPNIIAQISHPTTAQGTYAGIEEWYQRLHQGESISCWLEEMPEPFRSGQAAIGVKALFAVPIFVEELFWGVLSFDHCRQAKHPSTAELTLLKTAAACIGSAIQRQRIRQIEQKRTEELAKVNQELQQRDRLLSVVAQVTKNLLDTEDIDIAIPQALQAIGTVANISRVQVILERQNPTTQKLQHCITYEWVAGGISPQTHHPTMAVIDNDDAEILLRELYAGRSIWYLVDDLPHPLKEQFQSLNIKSSGGVPLFIEGRYIGCVAFDDCVTSRHWSQQEMDVLTTAAEGIGAALHRKQLVAHLIQERATTVEKRVAELVRANESLRGCVNRLADEPDLETFWEHILLEASAQAKSYAAALFLYDASTNTSLMKRYVREGKVIPIHTDPEFVQFRLPISANIFSYWQEALFKGEVIFFNVEDNKKLLGARIKWHRAQGHRSIVRVPLILGDRPLGFIGLCFREPRTSLPPNIELIIALAQQATLAIHLTSLAEQSRQAAILEERNRMAREIHDTLAQAFTGVIVQLGAASRIIPQNLPEVQEHITQARELAREGLAEARRSVNALRPQILETQNLPTAFHHLVTQMSAVIDTEIICKIIGEVYPLTVDVENNLLRIGQEALTNAIKHAFASEIVIELVYEPTQLILRVKDNGKGFAPESLAVVKGFGLMGIKERCDRIKAQLTIKSLPQPGTEITILIRRD